MDDQIFKKCLVGLLIGTICVGAYWLFMTRSNKTVLLNTSKKIEIMSNDE